MQFRISCSTRSATFAASAACWLLGSHASADIIQRFALTEGIYAVRGAPDFDQDRKAAPPIPGLSLDGKFHCAPTSIADMLAYISSHGMLLPGIPSDTWQDFDSVEYAAANQLIDTLGNAMLTNSGGNNGTSYGSLSNGLRWFLPDEDFTILEIGSTAASTIGVTGLSIAQMLTSSLIERPLSTACVGWANPLLAGQVWQWNGGHCFLISGASWNGTGATTLDILDPADSAGADTLTTQSGFDSFIYNPVDSQYNIVISCAGGGCNTFPITAGWMPGFAGGTTRGLLISQRVVFGTTYYTADSLGTSLKLVRPIRFEFESPASVTNLGLSLTQPLNELAFDFNSARLYAIAGSGASAQVQVTDGRSAPTTLPFGVVPKHIASGRMREVFIAALNGATPVMLRYSTDGLGTAPSVRSLPFAPDAICYDDATDMVHALHVASHTLLSMPRLEGGTNLTRAIPTSVTPTGVISICTRPGDSRIWIAGSGLNGKFYGVKYDAAGTPTIETATSSTIATPLSLHATTGGRLAFSSNGVMRVLVRNNSTGTWGVDSASPLFGKPCGSAFDLARDRNNIPHGDSYWDLMLDKKIEQVGTLSAPCIADLDLNRKVDAADLAMILGQWGGDGIGDFNQDDVIDAQDLGPLLGSWGNCP